jgi:hypothetical protein
MVNGGSYSRSKRIDAGRTFSYGLVTAFVYERSECATQAGAAGVCSVLQRDYRPGARQPRHYLGQLVEIPGCDGSHPGRAELRCREEALRHYQNMSQQEADLNDHLIYANQSFCDMTGY